MSGPWPRGRWPVLRAAGRWLWFPGARPVNRQRPFGGPNRSGHISRAARRFLCIVSDGWFGILFSFLFFVKTFVKIPGGADESDVREGLGKISEVLAAGAELFRVETQMIGV